MGSFFYRLPFVNEHCSGNRLDMGVAILRKHGLYDFVVIHHRANEHNHFDIRRHIYITPQVGGTQRIISFKCS